MKKIFVILAVFITAELSMAANISSHEYHVDAPTQYLSFDEETLIVTATGALPNRCAKTPHPELFTTSESNVLILKIVATQSSEKCLAMIGGQFDLAFDIRSLKFNLIEMNLDPEAIYKIESENQKFSQIIDFSQAPLNITYSSETLMGDVVSSESPEALSIVLPNYQVVSIKSPYIDVEAYKGKTVEVQGHLLKSRKPGFNFGSAQKSEPSFLITGINTTTY